MALSFTGFPAVLSADETEEESVYIEEIIVTSERGESNVLDRAMTVTGFNQVIIEKLGVQNADDLEVLVPGLQKGNRTQGGGKGEDGHYVMRGIGNDRSVNFYSDVSVAYYIDGVYTNQSYATDSTFDMERVRSNPGAAGHHRGQGVDRRRHQFLVAQADGYLRHARERGGHRYLDTALPDRIRRTYWRHPISAIVLGLSTYTGDGRIENVYPGGVDGGKPDQVIWTPRLRWTNDRWDITARYTYQTDDGTPWVSLPLGARDTVNEFLLDRNGEPAIWRDRITGEEVPQVNPFFGANAAPSVTNCSNISNDGTRDEFGIICDPDELQWKIAFNAPIYEDAESENFSVEGIFDVTDSLDVTYKFGYHDVVRETLDDPDQLPREGGGVCPANHPKVLGGMLQAGQTSQYCALDGGGNGTFNDTRLNRARLSEQTSHEITLTSNYDGKFNFTLGANYLDGERPSNSRTWDFGAGTRGTRGNDWLYDDTSAACREKYRGPLWLRG